MNNPCLILCILDGVGWGRQDHGNAVFTARTPILDQLMENSTWGLLRAHGTFVGMPSDSDMGNSEVGHNAMGAGRVFDQGAKLVNNAIQSGSIWTSRAWQQAIQGKTLHLVGLVSDGNVHSHVNHLRAMIHQAHADGVQRLCVHTLTDGRDVPARSALNYIPPLEELLAQLSPDYRIATGGGRMWITMDRYEADWKMVERGWNCHVHGHGERFSSATQAIEQLYSRDPKVNDQWLPAFVVGDYSGMNDGDAVIFINFRGDRAVEISRAFEETPFPHFDRGQVPKVFFAGMMEYDGDLKVPKNHLVAPPAIDNTVGENLAKAGKKSLAISETQKFGHVTFFFHGNRSESPQGETQIEVPSVAIPFDQCPEMAAHEVTSLVCEAIQTGKYDHIRLNLANGDMVGHTGNFHATVQAIEYIDACVGKIAQEAAQANAILLITADHGNADQMYQFNKKTGQYKRSPSGEPLPSTSHSCHPVPLILVDPTQQWTIAGEKGQVLGGIAQIGATILTICQASVPPDYLPSLVRRTVQ